MIHTYKNKWHEPHNEFTGPEFYATHSDPIPYRGCFIFHRLNYAFDVVKNGECVEQCATIEKAKQHINELIEMEG